MLELPAPFFSWLCAFVRSRNDLGLEILALRQQVAVLKRKRPRPRLNDSDRLFWIAFCGVSDPVQAGVMTVMAVADTAKFSVER